MNPFFQEPMEEDEMVASRFGEDLISSFSLALNDDGVDSHLESDETLLSLSRHALAEDITGPST